MNIDDEQLDEMLRDVKVPEALRQQLREIPSSHKVELKDSYKTSTGFGWVPMLAIVASLLLLMSLAISWFGDAGNGPGNGDSIAIAANSEVNSRENSVDVLSDVDFELQLLKTNLQSIDLALTRQKTKRMRRRLAQLKKSRLTVLGSTEQQSIALSMSCQAAIELGASLDTVRDELEEIQIQYPDSQGSSIAKRLLEEREFFN